MVMVMVMVNGLVMVKLMDYGIGWMDDVRW